MEFENENYQTVTFTTEEGEEVTFCVLEQTRINGVNYLLVTEDAEDENVDAYILKDVSKEEDEEAVYDMVEDDLEIKAIAAVFEEMLEDTEITTGED